MGNKDPVMSSTELAQLADHWWQAKEKRLEADKVAAALKAEEQKAFARIIEEMLHQKITAIGGQAVTLGLKSTVEPVAKDWEKIRAYVLESQDFSLLEKRLGKAAIKERWEQGVEVPGVEKFTVYSLSKSGVNV